jgi:predicted nucleotidyltransferase
MESERVDKELAREFEKMKIPENVEMAIKEFVEACKEKFKENLISIVLFGSYARGNFKETSDVDLLVIVKNLPKLWKGRKKLFEEIAKKIGEKYGKYIEILPLTEEEFTSNINHCNSFLITLFLGHRVLFDKNFFVESFKNFANIVRKERFLYYEGEKRWEIKELAEKYLQSFG